MLILSRKLSEQIVIGDGIVVTIVAIKGGNVRLGIEAPPNVSVDRKEIYEARRRESAPQKTQATGKKAGPSGSETGSA